MLGPKKIISAKKKVRMIDKKVLFAGTWQATLLFITPLSLALKGSSCLHVLQKRIGFPFSNSDFAHQECFPHSDTP